MYLASAGATIFETDTSNTDTSGVVIARWRVFGGGVAKRVSEKRIAGEEIAKRGTVGEKTAKEEVTGGKIVGRGAVRGKNAKRRLQ